MNSKSKNLTRVVIVLFVLNAIFLTWAILWKCGVPFIGSSTQRAINIIPFNGNTMWEMQLNVFLFIPYGFLLSALMAKHFPRKVLVIASTSVFMEIAQYALAAGRSDITDLLLNTTGGIIGIGVCFLLTKLFGKYSRIAVVIAGIFIVIFELYVSMSILLFGVVRLGFMTLKM